GERKRCGESRPCVTTRICHRSAHSGGPRRLLAPLSRGANYTPYGGRGHSVAASLATKEPLNNFHAGATGQLAGDDGAKQGEANSTALLASRATKPAPRQAPSLRVDARMRRLLRRSPRLVV